jgi:hypothetical protein
MTAGPARQRRAGTGGRAEIAAQHSFTRWQQMQFEGWHRWIAEEGGALFDIELLFPVGLRTVQARCRDDLAQAPPNGQRFVATLTYEVPQRPMLTAAELQAALGEDLDAPLAWPAALPLPVFDGYQLKPRPALTRSEDDRGRQQQRRRSRQTPTDAPVQWMLTGSEAPLFEGWHRWRAVEGARWFRVPLLAGLGLTTAEARFRDELTLSPLAVGGALWRAGATLELRARDMLTAAELPLVPAESEAALLAAIDGIHHAVNEQLWEESV